MTLCHLLILPRLPLRKCGYNLVARHLPSNSTYIVSKPPWEAGQTSHFFLCSWLLPHLSPLWEEEVAGVPRDPGGIFLLPPCHQRGVWEHKRQPTLPLFLYKSSCCPPGPQKERQSWANTRFGVPESPCHMTKFMLSQWQSTLTPNTCRPIPPSHENCPTCTPERYTFPTSHMSPFQFVHSMLYSLLNCIQNTH